MHTAENQAAFCPLSNLLTTFISYFISHEKLYFEEHTVPLHEYFFFCVNP